MGIYSYTHPPNTPAQGRLTQGTNDLTENIRCYLQTEELTIIIATICTHLFSNYSRAIHTQQFCIKIVLNAQNVNKLYPMKLVHNVISAVKSAMSDTWKSMEITQLYSPFPLGQGSQSQGTLPHVGDLPLLPGPGMFGGKSLSRALFLQSEGPGT